MKMTPSATFILRMTRKMRMPASASASSTIKFSSSSSSSASQHFQYQHKETMSDNNQNNNINNYLCTIVRGMSSMDASFSLSSHDAEDDPSKNWIEIKATDDGRGRGLYAIRPIPKDTLVMSGKVIDTTSTRGSHTIQTDWNTHVIMNEPAVLVNHSCDSLESVNVGIKPNEWGAYNFYALRQISNGEEILWDYETSESEIVGVDSCGCGSKYCRNQLHGFVHSKHQKLLLETYGKQYIAPYLFTTNPNNK